MFRGLFLSYGHGGSPLCQVDFNADAVGDLMWEKRREDVVEWN